MIIDKSQSVINTLRTLNESLGGLVLPDSVEYELEDILDDIQNKCLSIDYLLEQGYRDNS